MPRNEQTKSNSLRSRQRITNKTRLRVVVGSIDAETVTIGEDDGRGVLHSTQGVEAEDAAEHHLQEVLNAANKAATGSHKSTRPTTADAGTQATPSLQPPAQEHSFIPTPDAQGTVDNYNDLYPTKDWEMSYAILKFSETVEECRRYGLANRSYTMDERDAAWLEQWNQLARGEGTSTGSTRRSKGKMSEVAEDEQPVVIEEDWFELCMGLFENFSSMHFPYLHISQDYPPWSQFDTLFQQPYAPSLFASSLVPEGLPPQNELVTMARGIYPHWAERKAERRGRSIIPDVNLDEADDGNVYVCFRRREVKPIRKTRRMETTSIDKLTRLSNEFQSAIALTNKAIEREMLKEDMCAEDQTIWNFRARMVSITSKYPDLRNAEDDKWMVDKEKVKKPRITNDSLPPLKIPRIPASTPQVFDEMLDLGQPQVHPRARYEDIQHKIEQDVAKRKERNLLGWDDVTDAPLQLSIPTAQRYFKQLNKKDDKGTESESTRKGNHPTEFRHRVGRGGRRYLDRRMAPQSTNTKQSSPFTSTPLANRTKPSTTPFAFGGPSFYPAFSFHVRPWIGFPHAPIVSPSDPSSSSSGSSTSVPTELGNPLSPLSNDDTEELVKKMEERWRFDSDAQGDNTKPDARIIIDDFDYRQSNQRYALVKDREWLFQPDLSRTQAHIDPRINLTAPLQDAINSQAAQPTLAMQAVATINAIPPQPMTLGTPQQPLRLPMPANAIRPPNAPPGLSAQAIPRTPQQQQVVNFMMQQREKQAQVAQAQAQAQAQAAAQVQAQNQANGSAQSSPQAVNPPQPSPSQAPPQPLTLGNGAGLPVAAPFVPYGVNGVNGVNGGTASPPKQVNGYHHQSPLPSPHPPSAGLAGADAGTIVRVSTPIRKPTMPLQPSGNMQLNGYHGMQPNPGNLVNGYGGFNVNGIGGMSAGMYNNLQNMKMINQHNQMMAQYQAMQSQMTPLQVQQQQQLQHQQQQFQQHQQMQQMQQLQLMQMQQQAGALMNAGMQGHFADVNQGQHMMGMQQSQQMHGQNMFPAAMTPNINNNTSAMNMSVQNINLQLGPQNIPLRLPPNRAQQQQGGIQRPSTAMGGDFGMMTNGASPMMQPMQAMGMNVGNMAAAMSIARAPSTPLSLRSNGGLLPNGMQNGMPNGGMMMSRGQSAAPMMQSPMMRPTSAASMHSNMGMGMGPGQPGASLPVSLQGSPANLPQTPHLRQQTIPGS